jgi:hypothetical protein
MAIVDSFVGVYRALHTVRQVGDHIYPRFLGIQLLWD